VFVAVTVLLSATKGSLEREGSEPEEVVRGRTENSWVKREAEEAILVIESGAESEEEAMEVRSGKEEVLISVSRDGVIGGLGKLKFEPNQITTATVKTRTIR